MYCSSFYLVLTDVARDSVVSPLISLEADRAVEFYMAGDQFVFAK
jgi:hypothetical protein